MKYSIKLDKKERRISKEDEKYEQAFNTNF